MSKYTFLVTGSGRASAEQLAGTWLSKPEVTHRNTCAFFMQPLKILLIQQTGYGLTLEGSSASALVKSFKAKAALGGSVK